MVEGAVRSKDKVTGRLIYQGVGDFVLTLL
jgi:hypothetical protein